jgi:hypothetical protein
MLPQNPNSRPDEAPGEQSSGRDAPLDRGKLLHFPERPADPMLEPPSDTVREEQRRVFQSTPHNPDIEYQPPNPLLVVPPASMSLKLLGAIVALLLAAVFVGVMFYHWMNPLPRHPGQQSPNQGLERRLP